MVHGQTEINVAAWTPAGSATHRPKGAFAYEKAIEEYHEMYQARLPGEIPPGGPQSQKTTPIYDTLDALGAQWQEVYGWERPQYFGEPEQHSFLRSNAFDVVERRCGRPGAGRASPT